MSPLITIERFQFDSDWTLSQYFVNGQLHGFGVEDEIRPKKLRGETAIPNGTYILNHRQSPKFSNKFYYHDLSNKLISKVDYGALPQKTGWRPHDLLWLQNVPNFQYILIHWGNTDDDTDGCYIVGNKLGIVNGQHGVLESRSNYMKLYTKVYPLIQQGGQLILVK